MSIYEKIEAAFPATAANDQDNKLDAKWLKSLKDMTHINAHSEALVEVAKYLETINPKYKSLVTEAEKFMKLQDKQGYMTMDQKDDQYKLYNKLKAALKKELSDGQFKQVMACL